MSVLKVENLSYTYNPGMPNEAKALSNINLEIEEGTFVGVIGHTGCGKSTLISHFNGLTKPQQGKIILDGKDIWTEWPDIRQVRFNVGMVFQYPEYQLFEETCYKDIAFGPKNMGLSEEEIDARVKMAAEFCGITDEMLAGSPFDLSGGQKRRIAIAGIIAMKPKVLVLDEPTAMLDPIGRVKVIKTIKQLNREFGITVVLITHYMDEAAQADRIVVMSKGNIEKIGTPREIFSQVEWVKSLALDVPQTSDLMHQLNGHGYNLPTDAISIDECAAQLYKFLEE